MEAEKPVAIDPAPEAGGVRLNQMKLLVALDALLREGSVSGAAASLAMQTSAMSRMLNDLRELYDDRIFVRTGKGMRPTPFAESLRMRVRALAAETQTLLEGSQGNATLSASREDDGWNEPCRLPAPPLAVAPAVPLEAAPSPQILASKIAAIGDNADPHRRLGRYIAITAPGPGRSRPLTTEEARDALAIVLRGEADPVQVGALLMTIQYRGATALELAGFVQAIRAQCTEALTETGGRPDLDWPAYLSPNWRSPPWFIHAARLVAMAGHKVLLHGHFGGGAESGKLELASADAGIPVCLSLNEAARALQAGNIAYLPLGAMAPQVQSLVALHPLLQMRTPMHAAIPLVNPLGAPATLVGAANTSKRDLYRDMARMLGVEHLAIIGSIRDIAQLTPTRSTPLFRLVDGEDIDTTIPARPMTKADATGIFTQREYWRAVWSGAARDEQAETTIIHTTAAALVCLGGDPDHPFDAALRQAEALWTLRRK